MFTEYVDSLAGLPSVMSGWSDRTAVTTVGPVAWALGFAPTGTAVVYTTYTGGPGIGERFGTFVAIGADRIALDDGAQQQPAMGHFDVVGDPQLLIVRGPKVWKVAGGTATVIAAVPPLAWNGDVFITYDGSAAVYYDATFQPVVTRPLDGESGRLIGVTATRRRALMMFTSGSADVEYRQLCL